MYRVFVFNGCDLVKSSNTKDLANAIKNCESTQGDRFEIHQVGFESERDWTHYLFGERKPSGHIDWQKVPWRRM
jgi:hypothetical protein